MLFSIGYNILLGIIGGIISSIIVSRMFLISSEFKEEMNRLRQLMYKVGYFTGALDMHKDILSVVYDEKDNQEEYKMIIQELKQGLLPSLRDKLNDIKKELFGMSFSDKSMNVIYEEISDFVNDVSSIDEVKIMKLLEIKKMSENINNEFVKVEKNYKKNMAKKLLLDPVIIVVIITIMALVILTIVSFEIGL